ncbi:MAG: hypothetical protein AAB932_02740, partial [Patescibacteria group bacterium]
TTLKTLGLYKYTDQDTDEIGKLYNLEQLWVSVSPIRSLKGLSSLHKLHELTLAHCGSLESLAGLETLDTLEILDIETCRKITTIDELFRLTSLKRLCLNNMGIIDSLQPIALLPHLEELFFIESTRIKDGDIQQIHRIPRLCRVSFQNRKQYNAKREDFNFC